MRYRQALFLVLVLTGLVIAPHSDSQADDDWKFDFTPFYLWAINVTGDQQIGPVSGTVDVDFSDIYDNLDTAFILHFDAVHKSNWGFLVDINFLDLEEKQTIPAGVTRKIDLDLSLAEVSGFHRFRNGDHSYDLIMGGRYVSLDNEVSIVGGQRIASGDQDWVDPLVGGRWIWQIADDWALIVRGDIGGLQVGSDFAWHGLGVLYWQPFEYVSFIAGYRGLGMDYEDGNRNSRDYFHYDATVHGPVFGVNFTW